MLKNTPLSRYTVPLLHRRHAQTQQFLPLSFEWLTKSWPFVTFGLIRCKCQNPKLKIVIALFTVCLSSPLHSWRQASCSQFQCVFVFRSSPKMHPFATGWQYKSAVCSVKSSYDMCHPITTLHFYLITQAYVSLSVSLSPTNSLYTQKTTHSARSRLHDWRRVRKNARFGSEVSGWIGSMKEVGSPVKREVAKRTSHDIITSHAGQRRGESGTAEQLAACSSDLLGELSVGSLADPEGSKCSCWPGNLRRSISHSSCSWSPPRCCNLVPFRRLLGDLDWCSLLLEGLADSDSWPEGRTMSLSVPVAGTGDELASDLSILQKEKKGKQQTFVAISIPTVWLKNYRHWLCAVDLHAISSWMSRFDNFPNKSNVYKLDFRTFVQGF